MHDLEREGLAESRRQERLQARLALLGQLAADLLREIGEGAGSGELEQARWSRELDRVDAERESCGERLRASRLCSAELARELERAEEALALAERGKPSCWRSWSCRWSVPSRAVSWPGWAT